MKGIYQGTKVERVVISQYELASFLETLKCIMKGPKAIFPVIAIFVGKKCNLKLLVEQGFL